MGVDTPERAGRGRATQVSQLSDEVVRRLIGVGQVDIVVGLPTLNHADTIAATLDAVDVGLARHFPRARTVIIGADGGSSDGTPDIVAATRVVEARASGLRSRHRVAASYRGAPGRAGAIRLIFTAAELLQAQSVVVCDPDDTGFGPDRMGTFVEPLARDAMDVVAGAYRRHPLEGVLVSQLIRPVMRAAYRRHFEQPLLGSFGCSSRFAAGCLAADVWDRGPTSEAIEVWLSSTAASANYRAVQVSLGRLEAPRRAGSSLPAVFAPVVGALFDSLERHAGTWVDGDPALQEPISGPDHGPPIDLVTPAFDVSGLGATFRQDVRDLGPVLQQILAPETFAALAAIAEASQEAARYDDETWVETVNDFLAAHHRGVMDRGHIVQALQPLYLGRVASFLGGHAQSTTADIEQDLERLAERFESRRTRLVDRWHGTT